MTRCPRCKSEALEQRAVRYLQEYNDRVYLIEDVPAYVCTQCGEIILSEEIAEKIQRMVWRNEEPQRIEAVPVYKVV